MATQVTPWHFSGNPEGKKAYDVTFASYLNKLYALCNYTTPDKPVLNLGPGDPSYFPQYRTPIAAEAGIVDAVRTAHYNHYPRSDGLPIARQAVSGHLNSLKYPKWVNPTDVYLTLGSNQGTELMIQVLSSPNANILIPNPGYYQYESRAVYTGVQVRKYNLLPANGDFDLAEIETLADVNTVAIVIINPHNPLGTVYTSAQLQKVAETAKKLGILVISDEVYKDTVYGATPFTPMGKFATIAPVITLGGLSMGWIVPGWRLGWIALHDFEGALVTTGVKEALDYHMAISPNPVTFIQGALLQIFENTSNNFFSNMNTIYSENVDHIINKLLDAPCLKVAKKPEACTYLFPSLDLSLLKDITDDVDFCEKLAKEENLVLLPGSAVGLKNWIRICIAYDRDMLRDAMRRLADFYNRHKKA